MIRPVLRSTRLPLAGLALLLLAACAADDLAWRPPGQRQAQPAADARQAPADAPAESELAKRLASDAPAAPTPPAVPVALAAQAAAEVAKLEVRRGEGRLPFEEVVLDNGLRVLTLEDHSTPIVAVQVWYHVGSKNEQPDRQGFAHMFEHMMFRGTDRLGPKDHFEYVQRTGGVCNAYTAFDQTVYVNQLPSDQLEMMLWMEAERMAHLKIDEGGFATERKVVEEERRLGLNQPYGDVPEKLLAELFQVHPYRWTPIGQIEHLRASTSQDIQDFWDTWYVPNNATLVVVGDVSHERARTLAQTCFGWIPRCDDPPRVSVTEPEQTGLRKLTIEPDNGPVPIAGIAFRAVPEGHPDAVALEMLMGILGGGESSRVYIDLVRRKEVAMMGAGMYLGMEQAGFAAVIGLTKPAPFGEPDEVIDALWEQVDLVRAEGVTDEELAKVRKQVVRADVTSALTVASKASALGQAAVLWGDAQEANERVERMQAVTRDDIHRVAREYLLPERATEVIVKPSLASAFRSMLSGMAGLEETPEDGAGADDEEEVEGGERALAGGPKAGALAPAGYPQAPPVAPARAPEIDLSAEERVLDNGLKVVVVENHEVPYVSMALRLTSGAFTEDPAHPGIASMAAGLITKGTIARDAEALALELERNAINLSSGAGHDAASVSVSCLTEDAERAARLLSEVVQAPRFDDKEFRTLRDQTATGMAIEEKTPSVIADRALDEALWGSHPYGRPAAGTSEDLKGLTPELLRDWWGRFVRPDTAVLYVAGDLDVDRAVALADRYLGTWDAEGEPVDVPLPSFEPPQDLRITLVDRPGAIQSEIRAAHGGIVRSNPLFPTAVVLSQIFGGSFSSRLNDVLRVQKGLTYGARGGLSSQRFGGEFKVSTFTKTPTTAETVRTLLDEVERMRAEPPSEKELSDTIAYISGSFAGSLETPQSVAGRLWTLELNRLPRDWYERYVELVAGLTAEDVTRAARDLLDPGRLHVVVVGDAEAVQAELEEIAPVEVIRETEGGG